MSYDLNSPLFLENGEYNLLLYCNDSQGNWGLNNSINFKIYVDQTPPKISIISPTETLYKNSTVLIKINSEDSDLDKVWYTWDGKNITYKKETYVEFPDGSYTLHAWARDDLGHMAEDNVDFTVSKTESTVWKWIKILLIIFGVAILIAIAIIFLKKKGMFKSKFKKNNDKVLKIDFDSLKKKNLERLNKADYKHS